jgi:hypothetical protein
VEEELLQVDPLHVGQLPMEHIEGFGVAIHRCYMEGFLLLHPFQETDVDESFDLPRGESHPI